MGNEIKVLVLGHNGLLGNTVKSKMETSSGISVSVNNHRWPTDDFKNEVIKSNADFIINCIGAIHQKTKEFSINTDLPIWLDLNSNCRIIHPGTDCEMDEDPYGISKKNASDYIKNQGSKTKIIKTSIIGTEKETAYSFMSWFLNNPDGSSVRGFSNHLWNGNTTLTWTEHCIRMIRDWESFNTETILYSDCVSKFDMLNILNEVYSRKIEVILDERQGVNKCLNGDIKTPHIKEQLIALRDFNDK